MARGYQVVWAGRHRRGPWEALCSDYRQRIARAVPVHDRPIRVKTAADDPNRQRLEGEALLAALPDPCWIIALDAGGRSMRSELLARELRSVEQDWPHPVAFVIGSDLGLGPAVTRAARMVLSFGPMTLGHELARLVLYEQLYRSVSLARGIKYHRGPL